MSDSQRTTHSTTQVFGLALIAGVLAIILAVNVLLLGGGDFLGFLIGITLFAVVVTFVAWRFDTLWSRIVGLVGTVVILMTSFWLAFGVFQPFSPVEFITGLAFLIGFVLSVVGGVRAILAGRRSDVGQSKGEARQVAVVFSVIGLATVVSVVGFMATKTTVSDADAQGAVVVDMVEFLFNPEATQVAAGGTLLVTNSDMFTHDFTLDEFDISVTVGPGSETLINIPTATPGTYDYLCTLHSDGETGMKGTLTIES
jgi:plastocyanin